MKWWFKGLVVVLAAVWAGVLAWPDRNLHMVTCNVGQGDAIMIYRGTLQVLIDGGPPGKRAVDCLAAHMPFWDRQVELVVLTHPDADHAGGLPEVWKRYTVAQLVSVPVGKDTAVYKDLLGEVKDAGTRVSNVYTGDVIKMGRAQLEVIWPERGWVASRIGGGQLTMDNSEGAVLGASTDTPVNDFSIGGIFKYGEFEIMLTGDIDLEVLPDQLATGRMRQVEVLKVPHHGSKYGMNKEWLMAIKPALAVISVGRNSYGHPTKEALELLTGMGARVMRTDMDGEVEVVSDGKGWWVK